MTRIHISDEHLARLARQFFPHFTETMGKACVLDLLYIKYR